MKILKAIGSFLVIRGNHISIGLFLIILAASSVIFWKEPTTQHAVFLIGWLILTLGQVFILALRGITDTQYSIQLDLAKLRHPSQVVVVNSDKFNETFAKPFKIKFPENKNRDDINARLRQDYGMFLPYSDPRMTAKVTGEFPDAAGQFEPSTGYEEMEKERTIADPPTDFEALKERIDKGTKVMGDWDAQPDYSPDSPHYGKPHEDCCK